MSLREAPALGQGIFDYAPKSVGATDYLNLADEVMKRHSECGIADSAQSNEVADV